MYYEIAIDCLDRPRKRQIHTFLDLPVTSRNNDGQRRTEELLKAVHGVILCCLIMKPIVTPSGLLDASHMALKIVPTRDYIEPHPTSTPISVSKFETRIK